MEHKLVPYEAIACIQAKSVLVLAPHADDEVLGCGGAIIRHVAAGNTVRVVVATDGALSGTAHDHERDLREKECRSAAEFLGYGEPRFWALPDQSLTYGEDLVARILAEIGDAELVYAPSVLEIHPDHRALGMSAAEAVRRIGHGIRLAQYEVGSPLRPNVLLDISDIVEAKRTAIGHFASQLTKQRYDDHLLGLNCFRAYTLPKSVLAAEAFLLTASEDLERDPFGIYQSEHSRQQSLGLPLETTDFPFVTVIVRTTGRPELSQALDSIALQTYLNIEVVLVDATGFTPSLTETCGRFPLRIVGNGKQLTRSKAANVGLRAAWGDKLVFLDEDDLFLPDHIARLVEAFAGRSQVRAAYAGVRVENETGVIDIYDETISRSKMLIWNRLPIHSVLFDRGLLNSCQFDESLDLYEDWDFWLQMYCHTDFVHVPGISAIYRAGLGQSTVTNSDDNFEVEEIRRHIWQKWLPSVPEGRFISIISDYRRACGKLREAARTENDLRVLLAETRAKLASRETTIGEQANSLARALQFEKMARDAEAYRDILDSVRKSLSWKLTAPFRVVYRAFHREQ